MFNTWFSEVSVSTVLSIMSLICALYYGHKTAISPLRCLFFFFHGQTGNKSVLENSAINTHYCAYFKICRRLIRKELQYICIRLAMQYENTSAFISLLTNFYTSYARHPKMSNIAFFLFCYLIYSYKFRLVIIIMYSIIRVMKFISHFSKHVIVFIRKILNRPF